MGEPVEIELYYDPRDCRCLLSLNNADGERLACYSNIIKTCCLEDMNKITLQVDKYFYGDDFYAVNDKFIFYPSNSSDIRIFGDSNNYSMDLFIEVDDYLQGLFEDASYQVQ